MSFLFLYLHHYSTCDSMTQHEKAKAHAAMVKTHVLQVKEHVAGMILNLGIKSVRMDDVAADLGMSKRTLYEMFGDKEELLFQSIVHLMEERQREVTKRTAHCQNMLEILLVSVRMFCVEGRMGEMERRLTANMKKFYPQIFERVQDYHIEKSMGGLRYALDKCHEEGYLDPNADIELMTQLFFLSTGMLMSDGRVTMPEGVSREEAFGALVVNFLRGLSSSKGLMMIDQFLERERSQKQSEE